MSIRNLTRSLAVAAACTLLVAAPGHAAWTANGTPLCTAIGGQYSPAVIPDGAGGFIAAWEDTRNGGTDIYCQRFSRSGVPVIGWPANGVPVCTAPAEQIAPKLCTDGAGGAIIAWSDATLGATNYDIYAQRVTGNGQIAPGWPLSSSRGLQVCAAPFPQINIKMVQDASGGAWITWVDKRYNGTSLDVSVQHVLGTGTVDPTLPTDGEDAFNDVLYQQEQSLCADGAGGFWMAWSDERDRNFDNTLAYDVFFVHYLANCAPSPPLGYDGTQACIAIRPQTQPVIVPDGAGGVLIGWTDFRTTGTGDDMYAERFDSNADVHAGWPNLDVDKAVCTAVLPQDNPVGLTDGASGMFLVWRDWRSYPTYLRVYGTRLTSAGTIPAKWPANGLLLCNVAADQQQHQAVSDGAGGFLATWRDGRNANYDIYATRITDSATVAPGWPAAGVPVSVGAGTQQIPQMVTDGAGGAFIVWLDDRTDAGDLYAAHLTAGGNAAPTADVPPAAAARVAFALRGRSPTSGEVAMALALPAAARCDVRVIDAAGRSVRSLLPPGELPAGVHSITWDGEGDAGGIMPAGLYFVVAHAGGETHALRVVRTR